MSRVAFGRSLLTVSLPFLSQTAPNAFILSHPNSTNYLIISTNKAFSIKSIIMCNTCDVTNCYGKINTSKLLVTFNVFLLL
jgi:hypothetical protein